MNKADIWFLANASLPAVWFFAHLISKGLPSERGRLMLLAIPANLILIFLTDSTTIAAAAMMATIGITAYSALNYKDPPEPIPAPPPPPIPETVPEKNTSQELPFDLRFEHLQIVGGSGHGKTELLKSLIYEDMKRGRSIVVIDSQNDLVNALAERIPIGKLVVVDPVHAPPALNLFAVDTSPDLFEYIFQALDAQMTSKQQVAYRYLSKLVVKARGNIHLMRHLLEPNNDWQQYSHLLDEVQLSFFQNEYSSRQFNETRQQILRRLYQVLENPYLNTMLGAENCSIDVMDIVTSGKVLLVSTAKPQLKQIGASLLGRIFIAQVIDAAMSRTYRQDTFMYIDEFQDYAEDSAVLFNAFEQARKYRLGLIVAHQYLGQLPPQLQQSLAANTAIKAAGGVSAEDARKLANQMGTNADAILCRPKGMFLASARGFLTRDWPVEFGELNKYPKLHNISAVRAEMRKRYSPIPHRSVSPKTPPPTEKRDEW